jgi:hypothetical protein
MKVGSFPRIRDLKLSPDVNPLVDTNDIIVKRKHVRSGNGSLVGKLGDATIIHMVEERDDAEFVKVFGAGVAAAYDLTKAGMRVFQTVLVEYEKTPMSRGFADAVELYWFGAGLAGRDIGMSEPTFNRGLRELLGKRFLYPRSPGSYWINPSLFFKGNRVLFVKEYVRKHKVHLNESSGN